MQNLKCNDSTLADAQKNSTIPKRSNGFTLIELLTVIAIIAILVGLLLPVLALVKKNAKSAGTKALIHNMKVALDNYQMDYGQYPIEPGESSQIHLGDPGYYTMQCAAVGALATGSEDNGPMVKMLKKEKFLQVKSESLNNGRLMDNFGTPILFRFLVLTSDPTDPAPDKLTEVVYLWSYGDDRKNAVDASATYTHLPAPEYDNVESETIEVSPASNKDDITSWN